MNEAERLEHLRQVAMVRWRTKLEAQYAVFLNCGYAPTDLHLHLHLDARGALHGAEWEPLTAQSLDGGQPPSPRRHLPPSRRPPPPAP